MTTTDTITEDRPDLLDADTDADTDADAGAEADIDVEEGVEAERVRWRPDDLGLPLRRTSLKQWLLVLGSYLPLAAIGYWPAWIRWSSQMNGCNCWDRLLVDWFISWPPAAVAHGHPLLTTNYIDAPGGINLMWNTSMVALGAVASPLTESIGVVHTVTILLTAALALSASTMFLVLRRWTTWLPAAWLGGLVYGFSTYAIVEGGSGRLQLVFAPIPPLLLLVADKFARHEWSALRAGILFGFLMAVQLLISEELLAISFLMFLIGVVFIALTRWREFSDRAGDILRAGLVAVAVLVALTIYPLIVEFTGTARLTGPPQPRAQMAIFSSNLVSLITPGTSQLLSFGWADRISSSFSAALSGEITEYIGVPLAIFAIATVIILRRRLIVQLFAVTAVFSLLLSMGPRMLVDNHKTGIPGLDAALMHVPVFGDIIPSRFGLTFWISVAVLFGVGLDAVRVRAGLLLVRASRPFGRDHERSGGDQIDGRGFRIPVQGTAAVLTLVLGIGVLLPLVPNWPYPEVPANVPAFFTSPSVRSIEPGSLVVTYPYPVPLSAQGMVWQAAAGLRFRILGGYATAPNRAGDGTFVGDPNPVEACMFQIFLLGRAPTEFCPIRAMRQSVRTLGVTTVIADDGGRYVAVARRVLARVLEASPRQLDGVSLWQCDDPTPGTDCIWH